MDVTPPAQCFSYQCVQSDGFAALMNNRPTQVNHVDGVIVNDNPQSISPLYALS